MNQCPTLTQTRVPEFELDSLLAQNRCDAAQKRIDAQPSAYSDEDRYQVGKCFYSNAEFAKSQVIMEALDRRASLWADVQIKVDYALAKLATMSGNIPKALDRYDRVLQADPTSLEALCFEAKLGMQETGQSRPFDSIIQYIVNADQASDLAWKCVASYARQSPTLPNAQDIADHACRTLLQFPKWQEDPWRCLSDNIKHAYAEDPDRVVMELSRIEASQSRYLEARFQARLAGLLSDIQKNPRDPALLTELAQDYYEHRDFAMAADVLSIAADQVSDPDQKREIERRMAMAGYRAGDKASAREVLDRTHQLIPSDFHRIESVTRMAALAAIQDYSRVGMATARKLEPLLRGCDELLRSYPDDMAFLYYHERANWRIQEANRRPERMVTERTEQLRSIGSRWQSWLSALYLTEVALAYLHRGKLSLSNDALAARAAADFKEANDILLEVMVHKDELLERRDAVNIYNLMEAWLSYGWSNYNGGDFEAANPIFSAVVEAKDWPDTQKHSESLYDWPRQLIQPKQMVEAYRGAGASRDRLARKAYFNGAMDTAQTLAAEAVHLHEHGVAMAAPYMEKPPTPFEFSPSVDLIEGRRDGAVEEEEAVVGRGLVAYIGFFDPAVLNEQRFNLAVAYYWKAKILRASQKNDLALQTYDLARREFQVVLAAAPDHPESHRFLEYIAIVQGNLDQALVHFNEAKRLGTGQLPDAIIKLIEGLDAELKTTVDLSAERLARRKDYQKKRQELAKELARLRKL